MSVSRDAVPDVAKIILGFPNTTIPPIIGRPDYDSLQRVFKALRQNLASVYCVLGGGSHGWLGILLSSALYGTLSSTTAFVVPVDPGMILPTMPVTDPPPTPEEKKAHLLRFEETRSRYKMYVNITKAITKQISDTIDELYLRKIFSEYVGLNNRTLMQIYKHLIDTYGDIDEASLENNRLKMLEPWEPAQPWEAFEDRIEKCMEFAAAGKDPYTNVGVVNIAYNLVMASRLLPEQCKKWRAKDHKDKTWVNFCIEFGAEINDYNKNSDGNLSSAGVANNATPRSNPAPNYDGYLSETKDAFANLAKEKNEDDKLIAKLQSKVESQGAEIARLHQIIMANNGSPNNDGNRNDRRNSDRRNTDRSSKNTNYCWSHGYLVSKDHTSSSCEHKREGHVDTATRSNPCGGSTRNKDRL